MLDVGLSDAIHREVGAVNQLLLVVHGQTCLLYVNNHFLEAWFDRANDYPQLPTAGQVGVYLNDCGTTGIYSNFAVYPVTSPPALNWV